MYSDQTERLLDVLRLLERATAATLYNEKVESRTVVELSDQRGKLINHLWTLYDNLSIEYATKESTCANVVPKRENLVKWDGKPFACTDTVWVEPGRAIFPSGRI
jgi:hypothetical protein